MTHRWHFFRAGGVDQVSLRDQDDIRNLKELDQKLWVALAMPVQGVDLDPETLKLFDKANDGRIRVPDVLDTIAWAESTFVHLDGVLKGADHVELSTIKDDKVVTAAKRMLSDLGKTDSSTISVADANEITKAFEATVLNGDGIVIAASAGDDAELRRVIEDIITCAGPAIDRSGKPGVDRAKADAFFAAVDERIAWIQKGADPALLPAAEGTAAAREALCAVREKLDDYFARCKLAAFDARGAVALGVADAELAALATRTLTLADDEMAKLPLAQIQPSGKLPLDAINPAWGARIAAFTRDAVTPLIGARSTLTADDVAAVAAKLAPYEAWRAAEPKTMVDALDPAWLLQLSHVALRGKLHGLIIADLALAAEYDQIASVAKAVRVNRDFGRLLRNFVNFSDFYTRKDGVFQAGTLYLDARAMHLTVPVADVAKHATLASSADAYLVYCDVTREGKTKAIAAAITNGDAENIFIGRNGIFYDHENKDWDATITRVLGNPISIREAFWTPYKKLVKIIEDNITKRAAASNDASSAKLTDAAVAVAPAAAGVSPTTPTPPAKKIDLATVAALGVAIGGIGTLLGALLGTLFGLGPWLPIGVIALMLLISGPSMLLAWLKLRRRNLGPILDANGWAINNRAKINIPFGAAMTELAKLPPGSHRTLDDPYADRRVSWRLWLTLIFIVVLGVAWYLGQLDRYLPEQVRSTSVLGSSAPAAKKN